MNKILSWFTDPDHDWRYPFGIVAGFAFGLMIAAPIIVVLAWWYKIILSFLP